MAGKIVPLPQFPQIAEDWPKLSAVVSLNSSIIDCRATYRYHMLQALHRLKGIYTKYQLVHEYYLQNHLNPASALFDQEKSQQLSLCILWDFEALLLALHNALEVTDELRANISLRGRENGRDISRAAEQLILKAKNSWGEGLSQQRRAFRSIAPFQSAVCLAFVERSSGWRLQLNFPDEKSELQRGVELLGYGLKVFREMYRLDSALSRLIRKYQVEHSPQLSTPKARLANA